MIYRHPLRNRTNAQRVGYSMGLQIFLPFTPCPIGASAYRSSLCSDPRPAFIRITFPDFFVKIFDLLVSE